MTKKDEFLRISLTIAAVSILISILITSDCVMDYDSKKSAAPQQQSSSPGP